MNFASISAANRSFKCSNLFSLVLTALFWFLVILSLPEALVSLGPEFRYELNLAGLLFLVV